MCGETMCNENDQSLVGSVVTNLFPFVPKHTQKQGFNTESIFRVLTYNF